MKIGYDQNGVQECSDLYLHERALSEAQLLSTPALKDLPANAWRIMWDALNMMRGKLVVHRLSCGPLQDDGIPTRTLLKITDNWYLGPFHNSSNFSLLRVSPTYHPMSLGDVYCVNRLLLDCRLEAWRVWHALCIADKVIHCEAGRTTFKFPRKKKMKNAEAYERIKGWLTFEALREV